MPLDSSIKKCDPLPTQGFRCFVNNDDLNRLKNQYNFNTHASKSEMRSKVEFFDPNGNLVATAIKLGNQPDVPIRLFSTKKLEF